MWEEVYRCACADYGVTPREELLSVEDGIVRLNGNTFEHFNERFTDDELVALSATCARVPLVAELHLAYNNVTSRGAVALAEAMSSGFSTLQHLDLSYNSIEAEGVAALATATATHAALGTLLLRGNPVGGGCGAEVERLLAGDDNCGGGALVTLDLENTEQDTKSLVHVARGLLSNLMLTAINLGRPLVSNPDDVAYVVLHIALALKENRTLMKLSLDYFNMTDDDLEQLLLTLCDSAVVCLSLKGNKLSQDSGAKLARLLEHREDFCFLDVSANRLRDVGAVSLAAAVATHTGLRALHMCCNTVGGRGISAIAKAVGTNNSLSSLHLWGNDFSDDSVAALYDVRHKIDSLLDVDFSFYVVDGTPMLAHE